MSHNSWRSHIISLTAVDATIYSDSVVDVETVGCLAVLHVTAPPESRNTYPVVDLLVSRSPAKSASEYSGAARNSFWGGDQSKFGFLSFSKT